MSHTDTVFFINELDHFADVFIFMETWLLRIIFAKILIDLNDHKSSIPTLRFSRILSHKVPQILFECCFSDVVGLSTYKTHLCYQN